MRIVIVMKSSEVDINISHNKVWCESLAPASIVQVGIDIPIFSGVVLDVLQLLVLDLTGPVGLDGDGGGLMKVDRVNADVGGVSLALTHAACGYEFGNSLVGYLEESGWRDLVEVLLCEEIVAEFGEVWRREADSEVSGFIESNQNLFREAILSVSRGGAYFYQTGIIFELPGFPTTACL